MSRRPAPTLPDYGGACLTSVVPALLAADRSAFESWLPSAARDASQVVLLVVDGLGWQQLQERSDRAPTLSTMTGGPITSVAPTTTATALNSIVKGATPAEHGILGFKLHVGSGEVLNVLRWTTAAGDALDAHSPEAFRSVQPFEGKPVTAIIRSEHRGSGLTRVMLDGVRLRGWRAVSSLVVEVTRALAAGERFVYAYYDGLDAVAHDHGLGEHYNAELAMVDAIVRALLDALPTAGALVVTADHGHVDVAGRRSRIDSEVAKMTAFISGEPRFVWLHAKPGVDPAELASVAHDRHGHEAWVHTREEVVERGWFGGPVRSAWLGRLGDVAMAAFEPTAFWDTEKNGELRLVSMHGSLTPAEMEVPLVAASG